MHFNEVSVAVGVFTKASVWWVLMIWGKDKCLNIIDMLRAMCHMCNNVNTCGLYILTDISAFLGVCVLEGKLHLWVAVMI